MSDGDAVNLIRSALAFDWLRVEAQPLVALSDGNVAAEELLVRVADGDESFIPPLAFTETAAAADLTEASHLATRLAARGFRIALDDFGSGWGSFRYLKALPISVIKIDREFVRDITTNARALALVRGIVGLARLLGHETIAEGVEDEPTFVLLQSLGVEYAQGFHVGRPRPTD